MIDWFRSLLGPTRTHDAHAVVTGAGSGIGRALCLELARRGGRVVCADVDEVAAARTAAEIGTGRALAVACDVTDHAQVVALADAAQTWFGGPPSLVVNNAGIGAGGAALGDDDLADWHAAHAVNFWGVVHGCHVFTPRLRAAGGGAILNVASAASFAAAPRMGAYSTSKAAVLSLSETLAAETAGSGVTVTVLCPTFVRTAIATSGPVTPDASALAARLMELTGRSPESIARAALDGLDRGRVHVVPQLEAQLLWAAKRLAPATYTRVAGLVGAVVTHLAPTASEPDIPVTTPATVATGGR